MNGKRDKIGKERILGIVLSSPYKLDPGIGNNSQMVDIWKESVYNIDKLK